MGIRISDLTAAPTPLVGTEWIEVSVPGTPRVSRRASTQDIAGLARTPAVQTVTSSATVTPTFQDDLVKVTAQATALTLANPAGTPVEGHGIVLRLKDNGTVQPISYGSQYRGLGVTLPTTTVVNKTLYLAGIWNDTAAKLDIVAVAQEV